MGEILRKQCECKGGGDSGCRMFYLFISICCLSSPEDECIGIRRIFEGEEPSDDI